MYEAYFCCTMRFAEGLKCLNSFQCVRNSDGILIPYFNDFDCECEDFNISFRKIGNNEKGKIEINVKTDTPIKLLYDYNDVKNISTGSSMMLAVSVAGYYGIQIPEIKYSSELSFID